MLERHPQLVRMLLLMSASIIAGCANVATRSASRLRMKRSRSGNAISKSIVMAAAGATDLKPAPIPADWILNGTPHARNKELATSHDGTSSILVWDCTAGRFNWHYTEDEIVVVTSGEAFITSETGEERRLGPGDMGFFPAGTSCTWRVPNHVRKVAVFRQPMPRPLGSALRAWNRLLRSVRGSARMAADAGRSSHPATRLDGGRVAKSR
jgi:uncharacterized cupin superfamily protein